MITLNMEELLALNSVLDNKKIFGINLIGSIMEEEDRINNIFRGLEEKELVVGKDFTDKGFVVIKLLNDYKRCKDFVFINNLRIALVDSKRAILIELKENDEFHITRCLKVTIEKKLIIASTYLKQASKKRFIPYMKESITLEDIDKELDDHIWNEVIVLQKHKDSTNFVNCVYYMSEDEGYLYDYCNNMRTQKSPQDIRVDLMKYLEIGGNGFA